MTDYALTSYQLLRNKMIVLPYKLKFMMYMLGQHTHVVILIECYVKK